MTRAEFDDRAQFALMVLNLADVIEEFDDRLWVSIAREDWETLYPPAGAPAAPSTPPEVPL
jgi:hypothetical protein